MQYVTANTADKIAALKELDAEARRQLLSDAGRVEKYVSRNPWIEEDELRRYGERNDLPPDRLTAALALLVETDRVLAIGE